MQGDDGEAGTGSKFRGLQQFREAVIDVLQVDMLHCSICLHVALRAQCACC